jgi:uncharacterized short protein YbdD (DUF466 family)
MTRPAGFREALIRSATAAWRMLRHVSGDDAYERYVEHCRRCHPRQVPAGRREFHAARLTGKWSGIARCC